MTATELIKQLQCLPSGARVLVDGYEGGFSDIETPVLLRAHLNFNTDGYMGPHEECSDKTGKQPDQCWTCEENLKKEKSVRVDAIYIERK